MTTGQIQGALRDLKITQKELAHELRKSENAISKVILMEMVSDSIMRAISAKLGKDPWDVFDYYKKTPQRSTSKTIRPFKRIETKKRRAA